MAKDNSGLLKKKSGELEKKSDKKGLILIGDVLVEFDILLRDSFADVHRSESIIELRQKIENLLKYAQSAYPNHSMIGRYTTTYLILLSQNSVTPEFLKDGEEGQRVDYHKSPGKRSYVKEPVKIILSRGSRR